MTIVQALKKENEIYFINWKNNREMNWNKGMKEWMVYDPKGKSLCSTKDQDVAVDFLLGNRD